MIIDHPLAKKHPLIFNWIIIKLLLISYGFIEEFSIFLICQFLINTMVLKKNNTIYESFYLVFEIISGIIALQYNYESFITKIIIATTIAPCAILSIVFYIILIMHNKANKKTISFSITENEIDLITCPICFEDCEKIGYSICSNKHYYHKKCITDWCLISINNITCPICRQ
jgi:hypothetical protein